MDWISCINPIITTRERFKHDHMKGLNSTSTRIFIPFLENAQFIRIEGEGRIKNNFFIELFLIALVSEKQACSPKNYLRASLDKPRPLFKCPHIWLASGVLIHWNYAELNAWGTFCPSLQWHANVFIMQKLTNILLNWVFLLLGRDSRKFCKEYYYTFCGIRENAFMNITFKFEH